MPTNPDQIDRTMKPTSRPEEHRRRRDDSLIETASGAYEQAIRAGDGYLAEQIALDFLRQGSGVASLYSGVIAPAMTRIGELWEAGRLSIADEHLATALNLRVMASVYGLDLAAGGVLREGRVLLAGLEGDLHGVGLRMATDVLDLAGFETINIGEDLPVAELVHAIERTKPDLLGLSVPMAESRDRLLSTLETVRRTEPGMPILLGGRGVGPATGFDDPGIVVCGLDQLVEEAIGAIARHGVRDRADGVSSGFNRPRSSSAGESGPDQRWLSVATEAADLARLNARVAHSYRRLAFEDPLTRRPNRRAFEERLKVLSAVDNPPAMLLLLDLDGFKQVNDTHGHEAGDEVLVRFADVIADCLREGDFVARLGGDEFAVLLPNSDPASAESFANRLLDRVRTELRQWGVTATIGIAAAGEDRRHAMIEADLGLYSAKRDGGDRVAVRPAQDGHRRRPI